MTKNKRRLIFVVAGSIVWTGGILWLIVSRHVLVTHGRIIAALLLPLAPPAIYWNVLAMRRMPWLAFSMKLLVVGVVLVTISGGARFLFDFDHPALAWVSNGGAILILLSMLLGLISSVQEGKRRKEDTVRR